MSAYVGLDVSLKETAVSVRRGGKRIWRGKCASDPKVLADLIRARAPDAERVVFETGQLSTWFYHALKADGIPAICIDARHAKGWVTKITPIVAISWLIWIALMQREAGLVWFYCAAELIVIVAVPLKIRQRRNRIAARLAAEPLVRS